MCCNTKRKIADGLVEMLHEKPLRKVTVQDIMDCKDMKRQSFYYHFQDIYGVVEWIYEEEFEKVLGYDETERFEKWVCRVVHIIKENRFLYRKVLEAVERERVIEKIYSIVKEQVEKRILQGRNTNKMVERFVVRSICHFILDTVEMRKGPEEKEVLEATKNITELLQIPAEPSQKRNHTIEEMCLMTKQRYQDKIRA